MQLKELWKNLRGDQHRSCREREEELKDGLDTLTHEMEDLTDRIEALTGNRDSQDMLVKRLQSENDTHVKSLDELRRKYASQSNEKQKLASVNCHLESLSDDLKKRFELANSELKLYQRYFDSNLPARASFVEWKSEQPKED